MNSDPDGRTGSSLEVPQSIYLELQPDGLKHDPEAVTVTGLDLTKLESEGFAPQVAMLKLEQWLNQICSADQKVAVKMS